MVRRVLAILICISIGGGIWAGVYVWRQWRAVEQAMRDNQFDQARSQIDFCLWLWPRSAPVQLIASRAARLRGDYTEAEQRLNQCLKLPDADKTAVQLEFLLLRVQTGEVELVAPDLFRLADEDHPQKRLIYQSVARAYMQNLHLGPAFDCLNRWIREMPDDAEAYHWRGWVDERLSSPAAAMDDYRKALELKPDLHNVRLRLAEVLLADADAPAALPLLLELRKRFPERADVAARLGQCYFMQGEAALAEPLLIEASAQLPDDATLMLYRAKLDMQASRLEDAEKWLKRLLTVDPYDIDARYLLFLCLERLGRKEESEATLRDYQQRKDYLSRANKMLQDEASRPSTDPQTAYEAGAALLAVGQERTGLYWLFEALKRDPRHAATRRRLAEFYDAKGDHEKAEAHRKFLAADEKQAKSP